MRPLHAAPVSFAMLYCLSDTPSRPLVRIAGILSPLGSPGGTEQCICIVAMNLTGELGALSLAPFALDRAAHLGAAARLLVVIGADVFNLLDGGSQRTSGVGICFFARTTLSGVVWLVACIYPNVEFVVNWL